MIKEYNNFKKMYEILRISCKEIQKSMEEGEVISYFCIISNKDKSYITFYKEDGTQLIQVELKQEEKNIFELFNS